MYPQFEDEVKIEHLQGYLYVQQLIENTATSNAGAMKVYSINEINKVAENLEIVDLAISLILDRVKYSVEIKEVHHTFFKENAEFHFLKDWDMELKENLNNWFADKYLSANAIFESFKKYSEHHKDWTKEEREKYLKTGKLAEKESERKLREWKSNSRYFIDLLKALFSSLDIEVLKITFPKDKKNERVYPFHEMNSTWGWDFDIFILSSKNKKVILHLGNVLT
ncbi:MAG: hypothetical protein P1U56_17990 [Saprospiraceae bacterium]|nr:hypothetical protein [Saprospiraceae bacterium]